MDHPIFIGRKKGAPLALRLVAVKKPAHEPPKPRAGGAPSGAKGTFIRSPKEPLPLQSG